MNDTLVAKQQAATKEFDEQQAIIDRAKERQLELRGVWQTCEDLKTPDANTVVAEEKKEVTSGRKSK